MILGNVFIAILCFLVSCPLHVQTPNHQKCCHSLGKYICCENGEYLKIFANIVRAIMRCN